MRHTMLGVIESKSSEGQRFGYFHGKSSQHSLDRYHNPPQKKKQDAIITLSLHQDDDDIRRQKLGYIGNPNYYTRLILVTGHPGSGWKNSHPQIKSENTQTATPSRIQGWVLPLGNVQIRHQPNPSPDGLICTWQAQQMSDTDGDWCYMLTTWKSPGINS